MKDIHSWPVPQLQSCRGLADEQIYSTSNHTRWHILTSFQSYLVQVLLGRRQVAPLGVSEWTCKVGSAMSLSNELKTNWLNSPIRFLALHRFWYVWICFKSVMTFWVVLYQFIETDLQWFDVRLRSTLWRLWGVPLLGYSAWREGIGMVGPCSLHSHVIGFDFGMSSIHHLWHDVNASMVNSSMFVSELQWSIVFIAAKTGLPHSRLVW